MPFSVLDGKSSTPTAPIEDARIVDDAETPPKKVTTVFLDFLLFVRKTTDYLVNLLSRVTNMSQMRQPQISPPKN